jgi:hypothetical protein
LSPSSPPRIHRKGWVKFAGLLLVLAGLAGQSFGEKRYSIGGLECWVCGEFIPGTVYLMTDEVTGSKRHVCMDCVQLPDCCYVCSLPVKVGKTDLPDGRALCERDVKSVLLDEAVIRKLCGEVGGELDKQFSRFVTFPANVSFDVADRVTLMDLFKVPGKDYACPNVLGFMWPETNQQGAVEYPIRILTGQTPAATQATCAHELTHAWIKENVSAARQKELHRDAIEGFCELVAFMMMREKSETAQMALLRTNLYTRGQLDLFIEADQKFGFSQVVDWMKYGAADRLAADQPWRIQEAAAPRATNNVPLVFQPLPSTPSVALPERLQLKSISTGKRPFALINQCTLGVGETAKVRLADTNQVIRCKEIRVDSVLIEMVETGEIRELRFEKSPPASAR